MDGREPVDRADLTIQIAAVAALNEPLRRGLYRFVTSQPEPISRDQAARELDISRELAAFHLDKLVELGLLHVEFRRLSGRTGPGAGRPAKLYKPSDHQLNVTFPERRYDVAAHLMAQAFDGDGADRGKLTEAAHQFGEQLGEDARVRLGRRPSIERLLGEAVAVLSGYGFEPVREDEQVWLRNCPFATVASAHPDLVCGMNLALVDGLVAGLRTDAIQARLDPGSGRCCVVLAPGGSGGRRTGRWPRGRLPL